MRVNADSLLIRAAATSTSGTLNDLTTDLIMANNNNNKRECFLSSVRPADFPAKVIRCSEWQHRQNLSPHNCAVNLDESLAKGHTSPWAAWRCLNRLRTGVACSKEQRKRWKYFNGDTTCECGQAPETTKHMLQCPLLAHPCTLDDLQKFNENARKCVDKWKNAV